MHDLWSRLHVLRDTNAFRRISPLEKLGGLQMSSESGHSSCRDPLATGRHQEDFFSEWLAEGGREWGARQCCVILALYTCNPFLCFSCCQAKTLWDAFSNFYAATLKPLQHGRLFPRPPAWEPPRTLAEPGDVHGQSPWLTPTSHENLSTPRSK